MSDKLAPNIFRKKEQSGYYSGFFDGFNEGIHSMREDLEKANADRAKAILELNAAMEDLKKAMPCRACKHLAELEYCMNCYSENHWEWRGVTDG